MLPLEHSAILLTCIKRTLVLKTNFSLFLRMGVLHRFYCKVLAKKPTHGEIIEAQEVYIYMIQLFFEIYKVSDEFLKSYSIQ